MRSLSCHFVFGTTALIFLCGILKATFYNTELFISLSINPVDKWDKGEEQQSRKGDDDPPPSPTWGRIIRRITPSPDVLDVTTGGYNSSPVLITSK